MSEEKLPFAILPIEVFFDSRLSLTHLRVLGALLSFRNRSTGVVFPGRDAIAARTGLPVTKISTATTQLAALGWLTKTGRGGRSSPCAYEVTTPVAVTRAVLTSIETHAIENANDASGDAETVTDSVTVPHSVTVTETVTETADMVTDSGTVMPETVTESGTKGLPNPERAKKRPLTDKKEKMARTRSSADAGTRLALSGLPADWAAWIATERPDLDPGGTWDKFHDYWTAQAGAKARKRDWFAAWRFWVRNEYVDSHRRSGNGTHGSTHERRQRIHDQIRENVLRHVEEMD